MNFNDSQYAFGPALRRGWGFACLADERILFDAGENAQAIFRKRFGAKHIPVSAGSQIEI